MLTFMNNCQGREHAKLYGVGAFYDLYSEGPHALLARHLVPGDECVVATRIRGGDIQFDWYTFSGEKIMLAPDEPGVRTRVFFGSHTKSVCLSQAKAVASKPYSVFFNVNGDFKRHSVLRQK